MLSLNKRLAGIRERVGEKLKQNAALVNALAESMAASQAEEHTP